MNNVLIHLRPATLARLIAELIADHADEMDDGEFNFQTEAAKNAYADLLEAGIRSSSENDFFTMLDIAVDTELANKE